MVKLAGGSDLSYDRVIVSPGIDFMWESLPGMARSGAQERVLHAWKAGPQTLALRRQLEAMPNGGVYVLAIPLAPYRCPPGPYERACQVAHYFSKAKPRSKVLIVDANDDVTSKGPLFKKAWADRYKGIVEYRPKHNLTAVDAANMTLKFDVEPGGWHSPCWAMPRMRRTPSRTRSSSPSTKRSRLPDRTAAAGLSGLFATLLATISASGGSEP